MPRSPATADDARALNALIDQELGLEGLRISPAARERLTEALGGDRIASRNEIRKLALYCRGMGSIEEDHVLEIVGDASAVPSMTQSMPFSRGTPTGFSTPSARSSRRRQRSFWFCRPA
jgi:DNA polymerase III delta subunit